MQSKAAVKCLCVMSSLLLASCATREARIKAGPTENENMCQVFASIDGQDRGWMTPGQLQGEVMSARGGFGTNNYEILAKSSACGEPKSDDQRVREVFTSNEAVQRREKEADAEKRRAESRREDALDDAIRQAGCGSCFGREKEPLCLRKCPEMAARAEAAEKTGTRQLEAEQPKEEPKDGAQCRNRCVIEGLDCAKKCADNDDACGDRCISKTKTCQAGCR